MKKMPREHSGSIDQLMERIFHSVKTSKAKGSTLIEVPSRLGGDSVIAAENINSLNTALAQAEHVIVVRDAETIRATISKGRYSYEAFVFEKAPGKTYHLEEGLDVNVLAEERGVRADLIPLYNLFNRLSYMLPTTHESILEAIRSAQDPDPRLVEAASVYMPQVGEHFFPDTQGTIGGIGKVFADYVGELRQYDFLRQRVLDLGAELSGKKLWVAPFGDAQYIGKCLRGSKLPVPAENWDAFVTHLRYKGGAKERDAIRTIETELFPTPLMPID